MQGRVAAEFTHFFSLPFIRKEQRDSIFKLQRDLQNIFSKHYGKNGLRKSGHNLAHLTISMLTLDKQESQQKAKDLVRDLKDEIKNIMKGVSVDFKKLGYFTRFNKHTKQREITVIYLEIQENAHSYKIEEAVHLLLKTSCERGIIKKEDFGRMRIYQDKNSNKFKIGVGHLTLFRVNGIPQDELFKQAFAQACGIAKPLTFNCDSVDVSTRFDYDQSNFYRPLARINLR